MKKLFCFILFRCMGWKLQVTVPFREKCIFCVAPHTSNWDFLIGILYRKSMGFRSYFLMKKDWFFWPLGPLLKHMDGIPIDRSKHQHLTDYLADFISRQPEIHMAITPEGTRSLNSKWKKGFYFIAYKSNIPIQLYVIDYPHKTIICKREIIPNGDLETDFKAICNYYKDYADVAKYPEKFAVDEMV